MPDVQWRWATLRVGHLVEEAIVSVDGVQDSRTALLVLAEATAPTLPDLRWLVIEQRAEGGDCGGTPGH
jgi:hypothetical protein